MQDQNSKLQVNFHLTPLPGSGCLQDGAFFYAVSDRGTIRGTMYYFKDLNAKTGEIQRHIEFVRDVSSKEKEKLNQKLDEIRGKYH